MLKQMSFRLTEIQNIGSETEEIDNWERIRQHLRTHVNCIDVMSPQHLSLRQSVASFVSF